MGDPSAVQDVLRASGAKIAKVFDYESPDAINLIKGIVPLVIYRKYVDANYDSISPDAFVAALPDKLFGLGVVFEGINEPILSTVAQAQALSAWYVRFAELMHARGERVAAYSFSTGNPPLDLVPYLADGCAASDWAALHEYVKPTNDYSQIGRYKDFLNALPAYARRQVLITETGADAGGCSDCGWLGSIWNLTPAQYLAILQNIDLRYGGDDWLAGATIFQYGGGKPWAKFNVASISKSISFYIASQGGGEIPPMPIPTYPRAISPAPADPHLSKFPRPVNDNGNSLHFLLDPSDQNVQGYAPWLAKMQMKWTTVYGGDERQVTKTAKYLLDNFGIYSVMRIYANGDAPKVPDFWRNAAVVAQQVGVPPYFQIFNEPEDGRESWPDPAIFAHKWGARAEAIVGAGGFPGLQVLSKEYFDAVVPNVSDAVKNNMFFALHNYGANHPPKYPYPTKTVFEDDTAVLRFIEYAKWFKDAWGFVPPFIGTEGGWLYQNQDDKTLPPVTADLWKAWHLEMYNWFRTGVLSNGDPLPDYLFSVCPWLLFASNWYSDSWVNGLDDNLKAPLREALAAAPSFVRQFGNVPPPPTPTVSFTLTPDTILVGQSALLRWDCDAVQAVYLNGVGVVGHDQRTIVGTSGGTQTFALRVIYPDNSEHIFPRTLTILETPPPPLWAWSWCIARPIRPCKITTS